MKVFTKAIPALYNYARERGNEYNPLANKSHLKGLSDKEKQVQSLQTAEKHIQNLDEHIEHGFFSKLLINFVKGADPRQIRESFKDNEDFQKLSRQDQDVKIEETRVGLNAQNRFNFLFNTLQAVQSLTYANPTGFFDGLSTFGSALSMPFLLGYASKFLTQIIPHQGAATMVALGMNFFGYPLIQQLWNSTIGQFARGLDGGSGRGGQAALPTNLYGGGLTAAGLGA